MENKKKGTWIKRALACVLSAALALSVLPDMGEAKVVEAASTRQMINLGAEQLTTSTQLAESNLVSAYFGKNDSGKVAKYWLFETPNSQSVNEDSILLEAVQNTSNFTSTTKFNSSTKNAGQSNINEWKYSDLQTFFNGSSFYQKDGIFSDLERAAILKTTLNAKSKYTSKLNNTSYSAVDVASEDYIFPLSLYESVKYHKYQSDMVSPSIFTRSAVSDSTSDIYIRKSGYEFKTVAATGEYIYSPSFNLKKSAILFSSAAAFNKTSDLQAVNSITATNATWEFTLLDDGKSIKITDGSKVTRDDADDGTITVTVPYTYSDTNSKLLTNQVSVMITDKPYTEDDAVIAYYGKLKSVFSESGTASFKLPSKYAQKVCGEDYYAYIVAERVNTSNGTDYASEPCYFKIPGAKYRINLTGGTVADASDDGKYAAGTEITINYNKSDVPAGTKFSGWTGLDSVTFATGSSASSSSVTFTMPANSLTVAAVYAHVHDYATTWSSDASNHWHACISENTSGCTATEADKATHTASTWIEDKTATTEASGSRHKECTVCGYVMTTETIPQIVKAPTASKDSSDSETADFTVTLSTDTEGAAIYYTTDGTIPTVTESSGNFTPSGTTKLYSGAIAISGDESTKGGVTTTVKAIAVKSGMTQSDMLTRTYKVTIPHTHKWSSVTYKWNSDYTECTATRTCDSKYANVCDEPKQTETVTLAGGGVKQTVTQVVSCVNDELSTYTASFSNAAFVTQTKTGVKTASKLGHSYGDVTYTWSAGNATCTATKACERAGCTAATTGHTVTETVSATPTVTQQQACGKAEITMYTATFSKDVSFAKQTKQVETKAALAHSYGAPSYSWSSDAKTCTAKRVCANCGYTDSEEATIVNGKNVATITQVASCTDDEITTYTATFENSAFSQQTRTGVKTKDALGHSYASEYMVDEAATCTKEGSKSRHCTRSGCDARTDVKEIAKIAHTPSDWIVVTKPTTENTGLKHKICMVCDTELETASIDKLIVYNASTDGVTSYTVGLDTTYTITVDADASKLSSVEVDGAIVDPSNYTVEGGQPTKITFTKEYMSRLGGGDHKFAVNYTDGIAETSLNVIRIDEPAIAAQPTADKTSAQIGETVTFTMKATGEYLTYQWQVDKGDGTYVNIDGATSDTYTTDALTLAQNGYKFRCVVTNISGSVTSDAIALTVLAPSYAVIENADGTYASDTDTTYRIRANGDFVKFINLYMDGVLVDPSNYDAYEGSTIIVFKEAYLATLGPGVHEVLLTYSDGGTADTTLTITAKDTADGSVSNTSTGQDESNAGNTTSPKTSGNDTPIVWLFVLAMGSFAIVSGMYAMAREDARDKARK